MPSRRPQRVHYIRSDRSVFAGRSDSGRGGEYASVMSARVRSHIVDIVITHEERRKSLKEKLVRDRIYSYLSLYILTAHIAPLSPHGIVLRRRRLRWFPTVRKERKSDAN